MVNEVLEEMKRKKKSCVFLKVDYEKTYDSVKFLKSRIGGLGVDQIMIQRFAAILNCEVMVTHFVYLGMSLEGVIRKVRFGVGWLKAVVLSVLIQNALYGCKRVIVNPKKFLMGWGSDGRKVVWASWKKVCEPHEVGGLEILDLRVFNLALLGKWIWCLGSDKGVCGRRFLNLSMGIGEV
ncbi:uncharacterized protein [Phaseolus vulgaris]|uniref:uncharacterized protein n=1 Tax=Phaseolus vulgaris TaxID=3885 RepID=UPI0035CC7AF0